MRNPLRRECPQEVHAALRSVEAETSVGRSYLAGMLVYANIGRDRRKLNLAWVEGVADRVREFDGIKAKAARCPLAVTSSTPERAPPASAPSSSNDAHPDHAPAAVNRAGCAPTTSSGSPV